MRNRFLEGTGTLNDAKIFKSAGLSNIKGSIMHGYVPTQSVSIDYSGALYFGLKYWQHVSWGSGVAWSYAHTYLDASRYNTIYDDNITTVQPASYAVVYIMKVN